MAASTPTVILENTDEFDILKNRIKRSDIIGMLKVKDISENEKPYKAALIKKNNELVDEWNENVLAKIADDRDAVQALKVTRSFTCYSEARELSKLLNPIDADTEFSYLYYIPKISDEITTFWRTQLAKSIPEIHNIGVFPITVGWQVLKNAVQQYFATQKWERVYGKFSDPVLREVDLYKNHLDLATGKPLPFDMTEDVVKSIVQKIQTVTNIRISTDQELKGNILPDKLATLLKKSVKPNEEPFIKECTKCNNDLVDKWLMSIDRRKRYPFSVLTRLFTIFAERLEIEQYMNFSQYYPTITDEMITFWVWFFKTKTIEEMYDVGAFTVSMGFGVLQLAIRNHFVTKKWNKVYKHSKDMIVLDKLVTKNVDLFEGNTLPFGLSHEDMQDYADKVNNLNTVKVNVN